MKNEQPRQAEAKQGAFTHPRDYLGNRFAYLTVSPRARGLSIGLNLNPDKRCNFDCVYCEVDRRFRGGTAAIDLDVLAAELEAMLRLVHDGTLRESPAYAPLPPDLLQLRQVAISGDGEPTLCPQFREAVETIVHVRAISRHGFFKIVLITNASNLDAPQVQDGLRRLTREDEIWAKLEAGTQEQMNRINKPAVPLEKVMANILVVARQRPVVIQSLFPSLNGAGPTELEIEEYARRLKELRVAGAQIAAVQICSATRPILNPNCIHLPLRTLSRIAQVVRNKTGLNVGVF